VLKEVREKGTVSCTCAFAQAMPTRWAPRRRGMNAGLLNNAYVSVARAGERSATRFGKSSKL
jgi:hypothetical protein